MTIAVMAWLIAIPVLGIATGMRTMTPIAILCWFAYLGDLSVDGTWAGWTAKLTTVVIFSVLAVGELVWDKLPWVPARTMPTSLLVRIVFGGLVGAIAATGLEGAAIEGVILGGLGAILGACAGYHIRRALVEEAGWRDWTIAISEDVLAIVGAVLAMGFVTG